VCTLSRSETTGVAAAFSAAHPELRPLDLAGASQRSGDSTSGMLTLWPQDLDANGMFVAAWQRPS
jgi:16S rRNA (cytosine967-C5)-methyltransferase